MIHRLILSTISMLTLATCQNQAVNTQSSSEKTEIKTTPKSTPIKPSKSTEPEMSTGLPPDKEAVRIAEEEKASAASAQAGVVYLKEGENKFLKAYEMNVTFKKMIEDSRCPKDVNCVWAGVATAEVELIGLATRPVTVKLSTVSDANRGYSKAEQFNGYQISLVNVAPETTAAKGYSSLKGNYQIGIKIQKEGAGTSTTERGGTTTK
ncbi:hypothetical protein [Kaistella palustris]|uniref:hypothetical protein n=1 Tax=Kaistella palustris TaxID=493376 RepID=UPI0003FD9731|nr:hypothetical protein [Kaistella palustris]